MIRRAAQALAVLLAGCSAEPAPENVAGEGAGIAVGLWEIRSAVTRARGPNLPILARNRLVGPRPTRRLCISAAQAADFARRGPPPGAVILSRAQEPERYALRMALAERMPDGTILRLDIVSAGRRIGDC